MLRVCACVAVVSTVGAISSAVAADLPSQAVYKAPAAVVAQSWAGVYAGLNAGYASGRSSVVAAPTSVGAYFALANQQSVAANGRDTISPAGFTGGAQIGVNAQSGAIVYGIEADFNYFGIKKSRSVTVPYPTGPTFSYTVNQEVSADWLATVRPRLGVANGAWLPYVTGGLAATNLKYNNSFTDNLTFPTENGSVSKIVFGWTAGAGVEYAASQGWSLKAEYLYVHFNGVSSDTTLTNSIGNTAPFSNSADLSAHIVRVGINKKL